MLSFIARRNPLSEWARHVRSAAGAGLHLSAVQYKTPQPVAISKMTDNFLDGTSSAYLEDLERKYNEDPTSVDKTWAGFFRSIGAPPSLETIRTMC